MIVGFRFLPLERGVPAHTAFLWLTITALASLVVAAWVAVEAGRAASPAAPAPSTPSQDH